MNPEALREAGIAPTTIRIAVGDEDPRELIAHFIRAAELVIETACPGFADSFMRPEAIDGLYRTTYLDIHTRWIDSQCRTVELLR
jgi:O-acetylhomoserine (thiol)-lyase